MGHIANRVCGVIYEVAVPCGDGSFEMILLEAFWIDRIVIRQTAGQTWYLAKKKFGELMDTIHIGKETYYDQ